MSLKRKKVCISVVLVVAFFAVAVLMVSSINLFSLSKRNVEIEYSDFLKKVNLSSVAKFLSSKDRLKLINYFYEYQKLKASINSLSYNELNRFLFLGKYLTKFIEPEYLGMSNEVVKSVLSRYSKIANEQILSGDITNLDNRVNLLKQINKLNKQAEELYNMDKISKVAYQEIIEKLGDIEYHINLSSFGSKDIQIDLNDIAKTISREKASYSINADLSGFDGIEESLALAKKEIDSMKYIADFLNGVVDSSEQTYAPITEDSINMNKFSTIASNIDSESLGDILNIVQGGSGSYVGGEDIEFAKTVKLPNITIEGSVEDAWNINFDASSLNLDNLLAPLDMSLMFDKPMSSALKTITNVKVSGVYQGDIGVPDSNPTHSPEKTIIPDIPELTDSPSTTPGITNDPPGIPSITPDVSNSPTCVPNYSDTPVISPTESTPSSEHPHDAPMPWYRNIKINYTTVLKVVVVIALVVTSIIVVKFSNNYSDSEKKIIYEANSTFKDISKIPISYKERLIGLGLDVLSRISSSCIKDKIERTPREIVNIFVDKYFECDKKIVENFLKYYESALFYKLDVNAKLYEDFVELCNVIYGILSKEEEGIT